MELLMQDTKLSLNVSEKIFEYPFNKTLIHQVITSYSAGKRQGTSAQKSRSEITGSNKKPWKQKGTGRARAGSVKSPIWRSGGVTFASKTRNYKQKINKKMYRIALKSIISQLFRQNRLICLEDISLESCKTKCLIEKLKKLNLEKNKILIILKKQDKNLFLASRNLYTVQINTISNINLLKLVSYEKIILTKEVIKNFEALLI